MFSPCENPQKCPGSSGKKQRHKIIMRNVMPNVIWSIQNFSKSIGVNTALRNPPRVSSIHLPPNKCVLSYLFLPSVQIKRGIKIESTAALQLQSYDSALFCSTLMKHYIEASSLVAGAESRAKKGFSFQLCE